MTDYFEELCRQLERQGVEQDQQIIVSARTFSTTPLTVACSMTFQELCDFTRTGRIW